MKKILLLIMAMLLAVGTVLAGCAPPAEEEEEEEELVIKVAVAGPMTDIQGQNHWDGAVMARDEINAAGGVTIGGKKYLIELVQVETKETTPGEDGSMGTANLQAVIDDVDFVVGGFRTEIVSVYREVAMTAKKLFMNCGAATGALQFSVVTNYPKYKYWFKSTPYNETFLVTSLFRMLSTIASFLAGTLASIDAATNGTGVKAEFKTAPMPPLGTGRPRVHILMENAAWCAGMVAAAKARLPLMGFNVTGDHLVSPTADDITAELTAIKALNPHIIFTAFSGAVGAVYSKEKAALGIPAVTVGINVPGQELVHWANTDGKCEGEIILDTWAEDLENTPRTKAWFNSFVAKTGRYPVYTAGTYDAIKAVVRAMEATNSRSADVLIPWMEDPANAYTESIASPKIMYYPMPDITIEPGQLYALSEAQVRKLYNLDAYNWTYNQSHWECGFRAGVQQPHIAHDLAYGPGLVTGIGAQWQKIEGKGKKVGIWPMVLPAPSIDKYGNWSFAYPGTKKYILPIGGMLNIPWNPYA